MVIKKRDLLLLAVVVKSSQTSNVSSVGISFVSSPVSLTFSLTDLTPSTHPKVGSYFFGNSRGATLRESLPHTRPGMPFFISYFSGGRAVTHTLRDVATTHTQATLPRASHFFVLQEKSSHFIFSRATPRHTLRDVSTHTRETHRGVASEKNNIVGRRLQAVRICSPKVAKRLGSRWHLRVKRANAPHSEQNE